MCNERKEMVTLLEHRWRFISHFMEYVQRVCYNRQQLATLCEHMSSSPFSGSLCIFSVVHSWLPLLTLIYNSSWCESHNLEIVSLQKKGVTHIILYNSLFYFKMLNVNCLATVCMKYCQRWR